MIPGTSDFGSEQKYSIQKLANTHHIRNESRSTFFFLDFEGIFATHAKLGNSLVESKKKHSEGKLVEILLKLNETGGLFRTSGYADV